MSQADPAVGAGVLDPQTLGAEILAADRALRGHVRQTPVERSASLSELTGASVFLKLENYQVTGSFKARGATNKLLSLPDEVRARGVVAASSGNHGAGVAHAARALSSSAVVVVPMHAASSKVAAIRALGGEVIHHGDDCAISEAFARQLASDRGMTYVSPYNDRQVMAGQGTVGVELARQVENLDAVFVALGGGGLIGGVGSYLEHASPATEIVACSPERSPAMHACLQAGSIIDVPCHDTLSDATAGGVERGAITFDVCRQVIDRSLLVPEDAILGALLSFLQTHSMLIEGAAALAIAGLLQASEDGRYRGQNVAVVLCGANLGLEKLREVLA